MFSFRSHNRRHSSKVGSHRRTSRRLQVEALEARSLLSVDMGPIPYNGHLYYRLAPSTWTAAEDFAVNQLGGHLVTINGSAENEWIFDTFAQANQYGLWIGLTDRVSEGHWVWASGEPVTFTDWGYDSPNNHNNNEDYAMYMVREWGQVTARSRDWNDFRNDAIEDQPNNRGAVLQGVVEVVGTDLVASSLTWNTAQSGVDFGYEVSGAALTRDTTAALYWASGPTFADVIDPAHPVYDTPIEHPVGQYGPFYVPNSVLGTPPSGATHLLLVVDPNNTVAESDETNGSNVRWLRLPDIAVTSFTWNITTDVVNGSTGVVNGLDIRYEISGTDLPGPTTLTLYWAKGGVLAQPADVIDAETATGIHVLHVPLASLSQAPAGTTRLILVADPLTNSMPQGRVLESDESNNIRAVPLYALQRTSITFDPAIAGRLDQLAGEYYRLTHKILVLTSGFRSPEEEAQAIARLISARLALGQNIRQALSHVRNIYKGVNINVVLKNYDVALTPDENVPAMATAITQLLDKWNQQGRPGRPPLSYHLAGWAVDISVKGMTARDQQVLGQIASGLGLYVGGDEGGDPHIHLSFPQLRRRGS
ncbi:MAG: lectin-like protein [Isosphaeraceae bacterium]